MIGRWFNQWVEDRLAGAITLAADMRQAVELTYAPLIARGLTPADADLMTRWRAVVERCTGETHPQAQAGAVRAACTSVVFIRDNIGRLERAYREVRAAA